MDSRRAPSPHRQRPSNLTATREHKADAARDSYRAYSDSQRPESGFCSLLAVGIVILSGSALFATFSTVTGVVNFRRLGKSILWGARSGGSVDPTSGMNGHHARACEVVDSNACPINYTRFSVGEIRHGALPYFLGGRRPQLRGIEREPWELFCDAEANGPVCRFPMAISKKLMEMGESLFR